MVPPATTDTSSMILMLAKGKGRRYHWLSLALIPFVEKKSIKTLVKNFWPHELPLGLGSFGDGNEITPKIYGLDAINLEVADDFESQPMGVRTVLDRRNFMDSGFGLVLVCMNTVRI